MTTADHSTFTDEAMSCETAASERKPALPTAPMLSGVPFPPPKLTPVRPCLAMLGDRRPVYGLRFVSARAPPSRTVVNAGANSRKT
jgi:hypothetical protein